MVPVAGLDLHFRPGMGENYGVAAGDGDKRRSFAPHLMGSSPESTLRKGIPQRGIPFLGIYYTF
jgi:hypothetical protein